MLRITPDISIILFNSLIICAKILVVSDRWSQQSCWFCYTLAKLWLHAVQLDFALLSYLYKYVLLPNNYFSKGISNVTIWSCVIYYANNTYQKLLEMYSFCSTCLLLFNIVRNKRLIQVGITSVAVIYWCQANVL